MTLTFDDPAPEPDPRAWTARGFTVNEARGWIDAGFPPETAERWRARGVYGPVPARTWRAAGLTPHTVEPVLRAGMGPAEAVRWREMGCSPTEAAERHLAGERPHRRRPLARLFRRPRDRDLALDDAEARTMSALLRAGVCPGLARAYLDAGWRGREPLPWARAGVNATQAVLYRSLGWTPERAARAADAGQDAVDLLREWWDAGVPRADVAAWTAAGFGPEEAARAVAEGGTADRPGWTGNGTTERAARTGDGREPAP